MRRIVLDANILLSLLTDRDPDQQESAARLFERAAQGEYSLILHQVAITEAIFVLRNVYRVTATQISAMAREVLALPGVVSVDEMFWPLLWDLWPDKFTDFADAALAALMAQRRHDALATFDQRFATQLARQGLASYFG